MRSGQKIADHIVHYTVLGTAEIVMVKVSFPWLHSLLVSGF
jgi:hypothetical protein